MRRAEVPGAASEVAAFAQARDDVASRDVVRPSNAPAKACSSSDARRSRGAATRARGLEARAGRRASARPRPSRVQWQLLAAIGVVTPPQRSVPLVEPRDVLDAVERTATPPRRPLGRARGAATPDRARRRRARARRASARRAPCVAPAGPRADQHVVVQVRLTVAIDAVGETHDRSTIVAGSSTVVAARRSRTTSGALVRGSRSPRPPTRGARRRRRRRARRVQREQDRDRPRRRDDDVVADDAGRGCVRRVTTSATFSASTVAAEPPLRVTVAHAFELAGGVVREVASRHSSVARRPEALAPPSGTQRSP